MNKKFNIVLVLVIISLGLGVVNSAILLARGTTKTAKAGLGVCKYEGFAQVTEGEHKGLKLEGDLYVLNDPNSDRILGDFRLKGDPLGDGTKSIRMTGTTQSGEITMNFNIPNNGGRIVGTGDFSAAATGCEKDTLVEGLLSGPANNDKGDWEFYQSFTQLSACPPDSEVCGALGAFSNCFSNGGFPHLNNQGGVSCSYTGEPTS